MAVTPLLLANNDSFLRLSGKRGPGSCRGETKLDASDFFHGVRIRCPASGDERADDPFAYGCRPVQRSRIGPDRYSGIRVGIRLLGCGTVPHATG